MYVRSGIHGFLWISSLFNPLVYNDEHVPKYNVNDGASVFFSSINFINKYKLLHEYKESNWRKYWGLEAQNLFTKLFLILKRKQVGLVNVYKIYGGFFKETTHFEIWNFIIWLKMNVGVFHEYWWTTLTFQNLNLNNSIL